MELKVTPNLADHTSQVKSGQAIGRSAVDRPIIYITLSPAPPLSYFDAPGRPGSREGRDPNLIRRAGPNLMPRAGQLTALVPFRACCASQRGAVPEKVCSPPPSPSPSHRDSPNRPLYVDDRTAAFREAPPVFVAPPAHLNGRWGLSAPPPSPSFRHAIPGFRCSGGRWGAPLERKSASFLLSAYSPTEPYRPQSPAHPHPSW